MLAAPLAKRILRCVPDQVNAFEPVLSYHKYHKARRLPSILGSRRSHDSFFTDRGIP